MGIKQLFSIIRDNAPEAVKEGDIKGQFGRKVAIDACDAPVLSALSPANKYTVP